MFVWRCEPTYHEITLLYSILRKIYYIKKGILPPSRTFVKHIWKMKVALSPSSDSETCAAALCRQQNEVARHRDYSSNKWPDFTHFDIKSIFYKKIHKYLGGGKNLYEITPSFCPVSEGNFLQIFASTKILCIFL